MEKKLHFLSIPHPFRWNIPIKAVIALIAIFMQVASIYAQDINTKFTISVKEVPLKTVFETMRKQSKLDFIYSDDEIQKFKVTTNIKSADLATTMAEVLKNLPLTYSVKDNKIVSIQPKKVIVSNNTVTVKGKVVDEKKAPVEGATLLVEASNKGAISDTRGAFSLTLNVGDVIEISCVGMTATTHTVTQDVDNLVIRLATDALAVDDVVVTGIYTRKAESFTGSHASFTAKDLKAVGGTNVLQSLKSLDPSFAMLDNNEFGSDPNRLPDVEVRGKSSLIGMKDNLQADPNQPLFILDGFESDLQTIYNLDVNRILSITILKDAASTAIYGSKAANGVVVVETVKPKAGQLRVSYNGNVNISMPDLSSYNMMNSGEKLQFEKFAGRYKDGSDSGRDQALIEDYNRHLYDISRGIDTYWMAEPLRVGVNHRHSVYLDGGSENFQFNAGGSYNGITGVMKKSDREIIAGNIDLTYRVSKFQFTNKFRVENTVNQNPTVNYDKYVNTNPYYTKYNEDGFAEKWLEYNTLLRKESPNPIYNDQLNSYNKGKSTTFSNSFIAEWNPLQPLKFRARFGLGRTIGKNTVFKSPNHTDYETKDILDRGDYSSTNNDNFKYEGELTAIFGKTFNDIHQVNAVVGGNIYSNKSLIEGYAAHGFPAGNFTFPSFSKGYPENGTPTYLEAINRSVSMFANFGYSLKNKYLLDFSYRMNGSSVFGSSKRFANTWAVGLAWNIHNENFIKKNIDGINMLKVRGSIGNPGNQNFESFMTFTSYKYDFNTFNYFGMSTFINSFGNPNLKWQTTMDKNIGFDLTILNNRLTVNFDYYHKVTDPLLIAINVPLSTGVSVTNTNMGNQMTQGITASAMYYIIYKPENRITWNVRANIRHDRSELGGIGNRLTSLNKFGQKNKTLVRYYDGANPNALWAVRSKGIDPMTGREVYYKKDGSETYDYSYDDEVVIGSSRPTIEGVVGSGFKYRNFSLDVTFRYRLGGFAYNDALYSKVEGISNSSMNYNQDKRALYNRWQKPGDKAMFRDIASSVNTPISSRFVMKDNTFTLESLRVGYEIPYEVMQKWKMSSVKIDGYVNDLFRISSIKSERGTLYPFTRSFNLALTINF